MYAYVYTHGGQSNPVRNLKENTHGNEYGNERLEFFIYL